MEKRKISRVIEDVEKEIREFEPGEAAGVPLIANRVNSVVTYFWLHF